MPPLSPVYYDTAARIPGCAFRFVSVSVSVLFHTQQRKFCEFSRLLTDTPGCFSLQPWTIVSHPKVHKYVLSYVPASL